jgi:ribosome-associated heat shock protein Hsp15
MVRTRSSAAALVEAGHVRVNGARMLAPSHLLRANDVITLALDSSVRVLRVTGFTERRGDAAAARALYQFVSKKLSRG